MPARIAVVTSASTEYADVEAPPVGAALRDAGHAAEVVAWDQDLDWGGYDLVLVRSPWDYFDRLAEFLGWVDRVAAVSRLVNPPEVIRWNSHKGYLVELGGRGVPVLPTLVLGAGSPAAVEQVAATGWGQVVIKPAVDGGARAALRTHAGSEEAGRHVRALTVQGDVVVQPYAAGVERGEVSLLFFGGAFSHAVRKVPAAGDYRVQAHHGGTELAHEAAADEVEVAVAAMALAPGELTYARVDLVDVDGVPTLMELEVIEPDLFLRADAAAVGRLVAAVEQALG